MTMKKGLGRGFESLIPSGLLDESFDPTAGDDHKVSELRHIRLSEITPNPDQPRRQFDEASLQELSESIRVHGVLQPIVVTPKKSGGYEIVAGERRWRASGKAGSKTIPALVRTLTDQHKLEIALIENLQRRDLNPLETATAYGKLREQFNMSLEQIGATVGGRSVSAISNTLRLLKLPDNARKAVADGKITEGQARPLIDLDITQIETLLPRIIAEDWSARKIEQVVRETKQLGIKTAMKKPLVDSEFEATAKQLTTRLSTKVSLRQNASGGGQIVISFKNKKELDKITSHLR